MSMSSKSATRPLASDSGSEYLSPLRLVARRRLGRASQDGGAVGNAHEGSACSSNHQHGGAFSIAEASRLRPRIRFPICVSNNRNSITVGNNPFPPFPGTVVHSKPRILVEEDFSILNMHQCLAGLIANRELDATFATQVLMPY